MRSSSTFCCGVGLAASGALTAFFCSNSRCGKAYNQAVCTLQRLWIMEVSWFEIVKMGPNSFPKETRNWMKVMLWLYGTHRRIDVPRAPAAVLACIPHKPHLAAYQSHWKAPLDTREHSPSIRMCSGEPVAVQASPVPIKSLNTSLHFGTVLSLSLALDIRRTRCLSRCVLMQTLERKLYVLRPVS